MCFGKTLNWPKLSNSGDTLKHIVPSYSRKAISGQNNYLGKVTSYMMMETEMGYRGSKSKFVTPYFVKEQRVDGSYCIANSKMQLRCTLMGFERNYQIKIPTNQLNNRSFSTLSTQNTIDPWFITGFSDAEASFIISIYRDDKSKTGWRITPNLSIHIHIKDFAILESIRNSLGVGKVRKNSSSTAVFRVDNLQELLVVVDHFTKYPLIGFKVSDFLLFKECYDLIKQKQHLTQEGLEKIIALKCNLNKGLSDVLMEAFPNIVAVSRPHYNLKGIPNPNWISGFVTGDSTFCVTIEKSSGNKVGLRRRVRLIFGTCLHIRDRELLIGIANYFKLDEGKYIYDSVTRETSLLQIKNNSDIINKVIPFFNKYPILGVKSLDFADFKRVAELMKNKEHLTESGFSKIIKIVKQMNLDRNYSTSPIKESVNRKERGDKT
uniref:LAGLIDADG homing endonuclease n=1 Tax=Blastosporella zonata TaxID=530045 RepID=A0A386TXZ0_9AGAR|nr:LAGLIDADG homing endonuclease [Blastosporella zonata]YP_009517209.1 LAGLIDADG homing endonuclease [Blastosporella zonata]AYE93084.1 LAGLIDADG homing endonuclease [Blastosporella zonata]AYE93085.1 LAGLIDADG homing endonuclease [Blastosporella zonata]